MRNTKSVLNCFSFVFDWNKTKKEDGDTLTSVPPSYVLFVIKE